jgi:UbiD family decarboxylase
MRDFIDLLEKKGLLVRVGAEVDPEWEINGIVRKLEVERGPATLFERVKGYPFCPLLADTYNTEERFLLALETTKEKLPDLHHRATENPIPTRLVKTAPCKDNIVQSEDVDITKYPTPMWHKYDGGRYILTQALINTKDLDTGRINAGMYRGMILSKNTCTVWMSEGQHGMYDYRKYEAADKPMPVAVVIGYEPVIGVVGCTKYKYEDSEYAVAGGYKGEPVEMVKCETIDMEVPATAEIVLEGEILPGERAMCGPFGEWDGYYMGAREIPFMHVKAETYRNNPIFVGTRAGLYPGSIGVREMINTLTLKADLQKRVPGIVDFCRPGMSIGLEAIVSIKKMFPGHPQRVMSAIWSSPISHMTKNVIVVDDDIDVNNYAQVHWAITTRFVASRDLTILPKYEKGGDPSQPPSLRTMTGAMGIDATKPVEEWEREGAKFPITCDDTDIIKKVEAQWQKYRIPSTS